MKHQNIISINFLLLVIFTFFGSPILTNACDESFEGFGIFLGSIDHFAASPPNMVAKVVDTIYNDLGIRYFRTSYESAFSPSSDVYEIECQFNARICSWIEIHKIISEYQDTKFMASIWSPPSYMKNNLSNTLRIDQEHNFHYFIRNVTDLIKSKFKISIEHISPVNEPANIFSSWEHTIMLPEQLCRMVRDFNDSLISVCPENSYFTISVTYSQLSDPRCLDTCQIFATHAYELNVREDNDLRVYYDLVIRERTIPSHIPIWQTEVGSTFDNPEDNQMREALDLAINIVNFVGHTCIQRYYFWLAYTLGASGESLLWGNSNGDLTLPKKYYAYKHFSLAAYGGSMTVNKYDPVTGVSYLTFGNSKVVFVNNLSSNVTADWIDAISCIPRTFFCTTDVNNWIFSGNETILPAESICSCNYVKGAKRTEFLLWSLCRIFVTSLTHLLPNHFINHQTYFKEVWSYLRRWF